MSAKRVGEGGRQYTLSEELKLQSIRSSSLAKALLPYHPSSHPLASLVSLQGRLLALLQHLDTH